MDEKHKKFIDNLYKEKTNGAILFQIQNYFKLKDFESFFKYLIKWFYDKMAEYYHLEVYKASYKLLNEIYLHTKNLNKEYKYSLAEEIKTKCFEILLIIYKINREKDRVNLLDKALDDIEFIRVSFRLLKDLKIINIKKFSLLNLQIEDVKIQFEKWYWHEKY
jgi:hypothetical protein